MTRNRLARRATRHGIVALVFAWAITPVHAEEASVMGVFEELYDSFSISPVVAREDDAFMAEVKEARRERRADLSRISELAGADEACKGKLLHEMTPSCWDAIEKHVGELRLEMDQLTREIARERGR